MYKSFAIILLFLLSIAAWADEQPAITGTVSDSLGAVISGAKVVIFEGGKNIDSTTSDSAGKFHFKINHEGRYSVSAEAKTFATSSSDEVFAQPGHSVDISLTLSP